MAGLIKFFLRLLAVLGVLAVLVIIAVIAAMVFIDPNDYRDEIIDQVHEETGRELTIDGQIGLTFFPKLGLSLDHVALSNAEGFEAPFAEVDEVEIGVSLLPLVRGELVMDTTRLIGLRLNIGINEQGVGNWEDLVEETGPDHGAPGEGVDLGRDGDGKGFAGLAIGGIEILDAAVSFEDRQSGARHDVRDINISTGAISDDKPFDLQASFEYTSAKPEMKGRFDLSGTVLADTETASVSALRLDANLQGSDLPGGRIDVEMRGDINTGIQTQITTIDNLSLKLFGVALTGNVETRMSGDVPRTYGKLQIASFDIAGLLERLNAELPEGANPKLLGSASLDLAFATTPEAATIERLDITTGVGSVRTTASMKNLDTQSVTGTFELDSLKPRLIAEALGEVLDTADPEVPGSLSASADFDASKQHVDVDRFSVVLDQSSLKGTVSVKNFDKPTIRFALSLDAIDLDRYLPPASEVPVTPATAAPAAIQLPVEELRALDIDGTLRIGKLKASNITSENIEMRLIGAGGRLSINPASANLYGGTYQGDIRLDVRGDTPKMSLNESLKDVQVGPLLKDLTGEERLSGRARVAAKLTAEGIDPEQVKRTLNGNASFAFKDGAVAGINIAQMIREAYARLKGQPVVASGEPNETDFTELTGSLTATNGLVENRDLSMKSPLLRIAGDGTANLPTEAIDYRVKASVVGSLSGQGGGTITELKDVTVPVRIGGTFSEPSFAIDLESVLTQAVKQRAEEEVKKAISEQLKLPVPSGDEKQNGTDAIKGLLEGLFK